MITTQTYITISYAWTNTDILSTSLSLLALIIIISVRLSLRDVIQKTPALQLNRLIGILSASVFLTHNIIFLYLFLELSLIPITTVIIIWGYTPDRKRAIFNIVFYTIISSIPFLVFLISWSSIFRSLSLTIIKWTTTLSLFYTPTIIIIFATITFIVKLPVYPLHLWLPKAHLEAPTFGSIVLAATLLKLGGYGLIRLLSIKVLPSLQFSSIFSSIRIIGGLLARLFCLRLTDIKKIIALSSVVHIATIIPLSCSLTQFSRFSATLAIIFHGPASARLFLLTGILYSMYNSRRTLFLRALKTCSPPLAFIFLIATIANISAPPSTNLLIEILIFISLTLYSYLWMLILALTRLIVVVYSIIIYSSTSHGLLITTSNFTTPNSFLIALTWQIIPIYLFAPLVRVFLLENGWKKQKAVNLSMNFLLYEWSVSHLFAKQKKQKCHSLTTKFLHFFLLSGIEHSFIKDLWLPIRRKTIYV